MRNPDPVRNIAVAVAASLCGTAASVFHPLSSFLKSEITKRNEPNLGKIRSRPPSHHANKNNKKFDERTPELLENNHAPKNFATQERSNRCIFPQPGWLQSTPSEQPGFRTTMRRELAHFTPFVAAKCNTKPYKRRPCFVVKLKGSMLCVRPQIVARVIGSTL